jgi:hypothetical protein
VTVKGFTSAHLLLFERTGGSGLFSAGRAGVFSILPFLYIFYFGLSGAQDKSVDIDDVCTAEKTLRALRIT